MANPFTSAQAPQVSPAMQLIAPELVAEQLKNARLQQLAQMMREQGMKEDSGTQVINGWAVKKSPVEGLSKLASMLAGVYLQKQGDEKNSEIQRTFAEKLANAARGSSGTGYVDDAVYEMRGGLDDPIPEGERPVFGGQQQVNSAQSASTGNNPFSLGNLIQGTSIETIGGNNAGKAYWDSKTPTTMQRENEYLGIPVEVARQNAISEARVKGTQKLGNGETAILPDGQRITGIDQDNGINTVWVNGRPVNMPIQGTTDILANNAAAVQEGTNRATLAPVDALPRNPDGTYQPQTISQVINPSQASPVVFDPSKTYGTPPQILDNLIQVESSGNNLALNKDSGAMGHGQFIPSTLRDMAKRGIYFSPFEPKQARAAMDFYISELAKEEGGDYRRALARYGGFVTKDPTAYVNKVLNGVSFPAANTTQTAAPKGAGEPFGMKKSVEGNVDLANTRYTTLANKNSNAPVMLDALDNVIKYAPGAITGGLSEKRELVNSIEALIPGFSSAKTAQEKTDLLKKNMNRIVGSGSNVPGATDALRNIVEASNPNSKMGLKAIVEASRQLKSIIKMEQANQRVIEQLKLNNDFSGVIKADSEFNRIADPKIWELEDMSQQERLAYINSLSPQKAKELLEKREKIKAMGGL